MFDAASVGNPHDLILKLLRSCNNRISKVQDKDINTTGRSQNMFCFFQVAREDCQTVPVQKCDSVKDEQCRSVPRKVKTIKISKKGENY